MRCQVWTYFHTLRKLKPQLIAEHENLSSDAFATTVYVYARHKRTYVRTYFSPFQITRVLGRGEKGRQRDMRWRRQPLLFPLGVRFKADTSIIAASFLATTSERTNRSTLSTIDHSTFFNSIRLTYSHYCTYLISMMVYILKRNLLRLCWI